MSRAASMVDTTCTFAPRDGASREPRGHIARPDVDECVDTARGHVLERLGEPHGPR